MHTAMTDMVLSFNALKVDPQIWKLAINVCLRVCSFFCTSIKAESDSSLLFFLIVLFFLITISVDVVSGREFPDYGAYTVPEHFRSDWLNEVWDIRQDVSDDYRFVYMGPAGTW